MNSVNSPKLKEGLKKIKKMFICSIIFLIITIGIGVWAFLINTKDYKSVSMNSVILDNNKEDVYAHVDVNVSPYVFAEYDNTLDKYYLAFDNQKLMYILYLSPSDYEMLNKDGIEKTPIRITGMTKKTTDDVKALAIDAYNELMGKEVLSNSNFEDYLGAIFLDTTNQPTDIDLQIILAIISGSITIGLLIVVLASRKRTKKKINSFTNNEWKLIEEELDKEDTVYYKNLKLYLTEHYVVNLSSGIDIFSYDDILWMYPFLLKQYGITTSKNLVIVTKDKVRHQIANINNFSKKSKNNYEEVMNLIYNQNQKIAIGFTKENKKQMKDLYGIK